MGKKVKSKSGSYDSIKEFFVKNKNTTDSKKIEEEFKQEFPGRDFNHYFKNYDNTYQRKKDKSEKSKRRPLQIKSAKARKSKKCSNASCGSEDDFTNVVKKQLKKEGYDIKDSIKEFSNCNGKTVRPDIVCTKAGLTYIYEVKKCIHNHRFWTAIGQQMFHQFTHEKEKWKYIIAFPETVYEKEIEFNNNFPKYLEKKLNIEVRNFKWNKRS